MQFKTSLLSVLAICSYTLLNAQTEYVNPLIGTDGMGHTFPGACVPFGIVQFTKEKESEEEKENT